MKGDLASTTSAKGLGDVVDLLVVGAQDGTGFEIEDGLTLHSGAVVLPENAGCGKRTDDAHQLGVEPGTTTIVDEPDGCGGAVF